MNVESGSDLVGNVFSLNIRAKRLKIWICWISISNVSLIGSGSDLVGIMFFFLNKSHTSENWDMLDIDI